MNTKDPFKSDKPLYDHNVIYDTSHLPKELLELIKQLEEYDKEGDWFNYDIVFDQLEITSKSYLRHNKITEYDFKMILYKYGGLYD